LRQRGLHYSDDIVVSRSNVDIDSTRQGAEAMRLLLGRKPRPDGVFCYNDPLAIGAMNEVLEAGLRIPQDIAVIGCGNLHYDSSLRVPLSSVDQQNQLIGKHAGNILLRIIESRVRPDPTVVILDPTLIVRASTMRKPDSVGKSQPSVSKTNSSLKAAARAKKSRPKYRPDLRD
jgi:LacI family transcriptional regulator